MRIIAGQFRGRRLLSPVGEGTRPITDRVKQSLFDILGPRLVDARIYDCFAGTGSLGLEALSRGAAHVTFFESDRDALRRLQENIRALTVDQACTIVPRDLFRWFGSTQSIEPVDVVFLDPPYRFLRDRPGDLQQLARRIAEHHLRPGGLVIFRHDAADSLTLPWLRPVDVRTYGRMTLKFLSVDRQMLLPNEEAETM